jgi:hypothetical protein
MDIIKHFWYLVHVERQKEMVTVYTLTSQMTPMKTIRTTLVSAIYRQIGSCFGLFDIAGQTQYTYIVVKYKINLHLLREMLEKLTRGSIFYLFLKLVQINYIFFDNLRTLYIYLQRHNVIDVTLT